MSNLKIIPIGGVRENAKNMYTVEVNDEIYILDCGLKYPENEPLGIDTIIPDFSYLRENSQRIVGVFLTHGHADAIGALPYFLSEFNVPVFGSELTIALAKISVKADKNKRVANFNDFHIVNEKTEIDFAGTMVSFFRTTHSIPESLGIVIRTAEGNIVYTGDFRFDQTAAPEYQTDFGRLAEIGKDGVLALLSDSANAENPKETVDEREIYELVSDNFEYRKGRIIVACVASNILRVQQIFDAAAKNDRKVTLAGHDAEEIIHTALKLNKLKLPVEDLLVPFKNIKQFPDERIVILETGRSGEPLKSLQKMAVHRHPKVSLQEGDLVFITTTPSHAMDTMVARTKDMIYRAGADVKTIADELNSSGHASRNDLQLMMNLLKPRYVIPIQGEYRLMAANADCAREVGIPKENIFLTSKGDLLEYERNKFLLAASVEVGNTLIDGSGVGDIGNIVLRDRKALSEDGVFIAVVTINRKKKEIVDQPKITSRGFVYLKTSHDLILESQKIVIKVVQKNLDNKEFDWGHLKQDIRDQLNHFLYEQTKRHPVILPIIMETNQHHRFKKRKVIAQK
ncbi:ribonuclease J [Liquorilactobacillus sicerae]|uniref:ribonuclease J n=1 Tax=Liquorilactobacillus sicerae TaxID=1416943 RepID=UPI0024802F7A|nr:ribonuclease J [Liquorilactobacillus sicerae]